MTQVVLLARLGRFRYLDFDNLIRGSTGFGHWIHYESPKQPCVWALVSCALQLVSCSTLKICVATLWQKYCWLSKYMLHVMFSKPPPPGPEWFQRPKTGRDQSDSRFWIYCSATPYSRAYSRPCNFCRYPWRSFAIITFRDPRERVRLTTRRAASKVTRPLFPSDWGVWRARPRKSTMKYTFP